MPRTSATSGGPTVVLGTSGRVAPALVTVGTINDRTVLIDLEERTAPEYERFDRAMTELRAVVATLPIGRGWPVATRA